MTALARKVRIGLVQMSCGPKPEVNLKKAVFWIRAAARQGAKIVCLQELFRTVYFCQSRRAGPFNLAETIPGPSTEALSVVAKALKVVIVAALFEKAKSVYYNTAAVIDADGALLGRYRKMHIPLDPGFYEKFYFTPGNLGFRVFRTRYAAIGVLICWDQWFPEAARLATLAGAQILFFPTAIGWRPDRPQEARSYRQAWELIQRSQALANGVYAASANRVGLEGRLQFWGSSFVADPFGKVLRRAGRNHEGIIVADCDLKQIERTRREWPFLRDRRVDAYRQITSRAIK